MKTIMTHFFVTVSMVLLYICCKGKANPHEVTTVPVTPMTEQASAPRGTDIKSPLPVVRSVEELFAKQVENFPETKPATNLKKTTIPTGASFLAPNSFDAKYEFLQPSKSETVPWNHKYYVFSFKNIDILYGVIENTNAKEYIKHLYQDIGVQKGFRFTREAYRINKPTSGFFLHEEPMDGEVYILILDYGSNVIRFSINHQGMHQARSNISGYTDDELRKILFSLELPDPPK